LTVDIYVCVEPREGVLLHTGVVGRRDEHLCGSSHGATPIRIADGESKLYLHSCTVCACSQSFEAAENE